MVWVLLVDVSIEIWSGVVVAPPSTETLMPRLRSAAGPVMVAPRSL